MSAFVTSARSLDDKIPDSLSSQKEGRGAKGRGRLKRRRDLVAPHRGGGVRFLSFRVLFPLLDLKGMCHKRGPVRHSPHQSKGPCVEFLRRGGGCVNNGHCPTDDDPVDPTFLLTDHFEIFIVG